jgi:hypothetical protein
MLKEVQPFREERWKLPHFSRSCWEIILKAAGQPLGYLKASGQFLKGAGKLLGNAQLPAVSL